MTVRKGTYSVYYTGENEPGVQFALGLELQI